MLRSSDGLSIRTIGGVSSASLLQPDDVAHPFKVTATREVSGETVKWWLSVEPGYVRYNTSISTGIISNGGGVTTYAAGLGISADDLASGAHIDDFKIEMANCYKSKRYPGVNELSKNQYEADGATLVFAYMNNPGGGPPKLGITSLTTFNNYFAPNISGAFSCTPIIGIRATGGTYWRRICLNVMPIAYFAGGEVTQYCRDTLDMVVESETAWSTEVPFEGETDAEYMTRVGGNRRWGAYTYETGVSGAPPGYTFDDFPS